MALEYAHRAMMYLYLFLVIFFAYSFVKNSAVLLQGPPFLTLYGLSFQLGLTWVETGPWC